MSLTFEYVLIPERARPVRRPAPPKPVRPPRFAKDRVAHLLALGHRIVRMYEAGEIEDFNEVAIRLHKTPSRITQIVRLTTLAPDLQERILLGTLTIAEGKIRKALDSADWDEQRAFLRTEMNR